MILRVMKAVIPVAAILLIVSMAKVVLFEGLEEGLLKSVGKSVVVVSYQHHGGTGFAVRAPSGKTVIVTNEHVCSFTNIGAMSIRTNDSIYRYEAKVIQSDSLIDLCALENPLNLPGLSLETNVNALDMFYVIGHPLLLPLTVSKGNITEVDDLEVAPSEYFNALLVSSKVSPGNSGSPLVNANGDVIGVVALEYQLNGTAAVIPAVTLQRFISDL